MTTMDMMQSSSQKAERKTGNVLVVLNGPFWGRGGGEECAGDISCHSNVLSID